MLMIWTVRKMSMLMRDDTSQRWFRFAVMRQKAARPVFRTDAYYEPYRPSGKIENE